MVQIPGISVQKNAAGTITHVIIDVEQQRELERLEIVEEDDFDTAFAQTLEESEAIVLNVVKESYVK